MRPAGEAHLALIQAAHKIKAERAASGQGATLAELAARACVGYKVARMLVPSLKRRGHLTVTGARQVPSRGRPAAEYAPTETTSMEQGWAPLGRCMTGWTR
jgi:hypothetical protein